MYHAFLPAVVLFFSARCCIILFYPPLYHTFLAAIFRSLRGPERLSRDSFFCFFTPLSCIIVFSIPQKPAQVWALFLLCRLSVPGKTLCATKTNKVVLYLWQPVRLDYRGFGAVLVEAPGRLLGGSSHSLSRARGVRLDYRGFEVVRCRGGWRRFAFSFPGASQEPPPQGGPQLRDRYHWIIEDLKWCVAGVR